MDHVDSLTGDSPDDLVGQRTFSDVLADICRQISDALEAEDSLLFLYDDLAATATAIPDVSDFARRLRRDDLPERAPAEILSALSDEQMRHYPRAADAFPDAPELQLIFGDREVLLVPLCQGAAVGILVLALEPGRFDQRMQPRAGVLGRSAAKQILKARPDVGHHCLFRRILDVDPGGIAAVEGPEHVFTYASATFRQMLDRQNVPFLGRPLDHVLSGRLGEKLANLLDSVRARGETLHEPALQVGDELGLRHYEMHLIPELTAAQAVSAVYIILWPRTEVMAIRQALETTIHKLTESQSLLSAVLDNTNNGIFLVGADRRVLYANRRMGEIFGLDLKPAIGMDKQVVASEQLRHRVADPDAFQSRLSYLYDHLEERAVDEVEIIRPTRRVLERYSAPVHTDDGSLLGRIEVYSDVTEVRELQRSKDEFLSVVSHELRTPVTSIRGYAQLLQRRARKAQLPESTLMAYATIERQTTRMQELIDMLLDLTRLETGSLRLQITKVNLSDLVARVSEMVQTTTETHSIEMQMPAKPVWLHGDEHRLEQVMINLLTNAVRYSPKGGPITIALVDAGDAAHISVTDRGQGIARDAWPRVFERFFRASDNPLSAGMGVGLYISKGIVEQHGGSIGVYSEVGEGSTFTVRLPQGGVPAP